MAVIKRTSLPLTILVLIVAGTGYGLYLMDSDVPKAYAQERERSAIDQATYDGVQSLRLEWSLTQADLAAMGLTEEQTINVLDALVAWHGNNHAQLMTDRRAVTNARRNLRLAYRKANIGASDAPEAFDIRTLTQALVAAEDARKSTETGLVQSVESQLTTEQRSKWQRGRDQRQLPIPHRYLSGLSDSQRTRLSRMSRDLRGMDITPSALEQDILSVSQQNEKLLLITQMSINANGVVKAEDTVLRVPDSIPVE